MGVTLKQIAEIANVSRGTVDRAIHNRGRVDTEVANRIKKIAEDLGYQPNRAGKALSMARKTLQIGVIVQFSDTPFIQEVLEGVNRAKTEIELMGGQVLIECIDGIDVQRTIYTMQKMQKENISGIALVPSDDKQLRQVINQFVQDSQIPIVTFNSDLEDTKRLCFVGQDTMNSGRTAAGLMGEILNNKGLVSIITGRSFNLALKKRIKGFQSEMKRSYPKIRVLDPDFAMDNNEHAKQIVLRQLQAYPALQGIYVTSHGVSGVCEALKEKNLIGKIKLIAHDFTKENRKNLENGIINFLIGQDSAAEGYDPIMILYRLLLDDEIPSEEFLYNEIKIKNRYNL